MEKEEILQKSRSENTGTDEYERQILEKAGKLAAQVGLLACCIIAASSVAVTGKVNAGCWVIYFSMYASLFWVKYRRLHKRHELMLAGISTAVGLLFLAIFILELVRWPHG